MFEIVSNPFQEMVQGVAENDLGYIAEKSSKSNNFGWLWWLLIPIVLVIMDLFTLPIKIRKRRNWKKHGREN